MFKLQFEIFFFFFGLGITHNSNATLLWWVLLFFFFLCFMDFIHIIRNSFFSLSCVSFIRPVATRSSRNKSMYFWRHAKNKSFEYTNQISALKIPSRISKYFLSTSENNLLGNISVTSILYGNSTAEDWWSCIILKLRLLSNLLVQFRTFII